MVLDGQRPGVRGGQHRSVAGEMGRARADRRGQAGVPQRPLQAGFKHLPGLANDVATSAQDATRSATMIIRLPYSSSGDSTWPMISRVTSSRGGRWPGRRALRADPAAENFIASHRIGTIGDIATEVGLQRSV